MRAFLVLGAALCIICSVDGGPLSSSWNALLCDHDDFEGNEPVELPVLFTREVAFRAASSALATVGGRVRLSATYSGASSVTGRNVSSNGTAADAVLSLEWAGAVGVDETPFEDLLKDQRGPTSSQQFSGAERRAGSGGHDVTQRGAAEDRSDDSAFDVFVRSQGTARSQRRRSALRNGEAATAASPVETIVDPDVGDAGASLKLTVIGAPAESKGRVVLTVNVTAEWIDASPVRKAWVAISVVTSAPRVEIEPVAALRAENDTLPLLGFGALTDISVEITGTGTVADDTIINSGTTAATRVTAVAESEWSLVCTFQPLDPVRASVFPRGTDEGTIATEAPDSAESATTGDDAEHRILASVRSLSGATEGVDPITIVVQCTSSGGAQNILGSVSFRARFRPSPARIEVVPEGAFVPFRGAAEVSAWIARAPAGSAPALAENVTVAFLVSAVGEAAADPSVARKVFASPDAVAIPTQYLAAPSVSAGASSPEPSPSASASGSPDSSPIEALSDGVRVTTAVSCAGAGPALLAARLSGPGAGFAGGIGSVAFTCRGPQIFLDLVSPVAEVTAASSVAAKVSLSGEPSAAVTVALSAVPPRSFIELEPAAPLTFDADTWDTPQNVTISLARDVAASPALWGADGGSAADGIDFVVTAAVASTEDPAFVRAEVGALPLHARPSRVIVAPEWIKIDAPVGARSASEWVPANVTVSLEAEPAEPVTVRVVTSGGPWSAEIAVAPREIVFPAGPGYDAPRAVTISRVSGGGFAQLTVVATGAYASHVSLVTVYVRPPDDAIEVEPAYTSSAMSQSQQASDENAGAMFVRFGTPREVAISLHTRPAADVTVSVSVVTDPEAAGDEAAAAAPAPAAPAPAPERAAEVEEATVVFPVDTYFYPVTVTVYHEAGPLDAVLVARAAGGGYTGVVGELPLVTSGSARLLTTPPVVSVLLTAVPEHAVAEVLVGADVSGAALYPRGTVMYSASVGDAAEAVGVRATPESVSVAYDGTLESARTLRAPFAVSISSNDALSGGTAVAPALVEFATRGGAYDGTAGALVVHAGVPFLEVLPRSALFEGLSASIDVSLGTVPAGRGDVVVTVTLAGDASAAVSASRVEPREIVFRDPAADPATAAATTTAAASPAIQVNVTAGYGVGGGTLVLMLNASGGGGTYDGVGLDVPLAVSRLPPACEGTCVDDVEESLIGNCSGIVCQCASTVAAITEVTSLGDLTAAANLAEPRNHLCARAPSVATVVNRVSSTLAAAEGELASALLRTYGTTEGVDTTFVLGGDFVPDSLRAPVAPSSGPGESEEDDLTDEELAQAEAAAAQAEAEAIETGDIVDVAGMILVSHGEAPPKVQSYTQVYPTPGLARVFAHPSDVEADVFVALGPAPPWLPASARDTILAELGVLDAPARRASAPQQQQQQRASTNGSVAGAATVAVNGSAAPGNATLNATATVAPVATAATVYLVPGTTTASGGAVFWCPTNTQEITLSTGVDYAGAANQPMHVLFGSFSAYKIVAGRTAVPAPRRSGSVGEVTLTVNPVLSDTVATIIAIVLASGLFLITVGTIGVAIVASRNPKFRARVVDILHYTNLDFEVDDDFTRSKAVRVREQRERVREMQDKAAGALGAAKDTLQSSDADDIRRRLGIPAGGPDPDSARASADLGARHEVPGAVDDSSARAALGAPTAAAGHGGASTRAPARDVLPAVGPSVGPAAAAGTRAPAALADAPRPPAGIGSRSHPLAPLPGSANPALQAPFDPRTAPSMGAARRGRLAPIEGADDRRARAQEAIAARAATRTAEGVVHRYEAETAVAGFAEDADRARQDQEFRERLAARSKARGAVAPASAGLSQRVAFGDGDGAGGDGALMTEAERKREDARRARRAVRMRNAGAVAPAAAAIAGGAATAYYANKWSTNVRRRRTAAGTAAAGTAAAVAGGAAVASGAAAGAAADTGADAATVLAASSGGSDGSAEPDDGSSCWTVFTSACRSTVRGAANVGTSIRNFAGRASRVPLRGYIVVTVMAVLAVVAAAIAVMFNISLFHSAFTGLSVNLPSLDSLARALRRVMGPIAEVAVSLMDLMDRLNFIKSFEWCGGVLVLIVPYAMIAAVVFFRVLLGKDLLLRAGISIHAYAIGAGWGRKLSIKALGKTMQLIVLFAIQLSVDLLARLVVSAFSATDSCSAVDRAAVIIGRFFIVAVILAFLVINWTLFTGMPTGKSRYMVIDYLYGVPRLVLMSCGVWTNDTAVSYAVRERASTYDKNGEDSDDQQEEVARMTGRSRALVWIALPFGIVLTKLSEAANSPVVSNLTTKVRDPVTGTYVFDGQRLLTLHSPFWVRSLLWIGNVFRLFFVLVFVVFATDWALVLTVCALGPEFIANFVQGLAAVSSSVVK